MDQGLVPLQRRISPRALERLDPFPDTSSRATGHALNNALQAYRVTGDATILDAIAAHIRTYLRPEQDPAYGDQSLAVEDSGGGFQTGYLMRAIVDYLEEVRARGDRQAYAEGFNYLSGLMAWNYHFGNFPYYFDARGGGQGSFQRLQPDPGRSAGLVLLAHRQTGHPEPTGPVHYRRDQRRGDALR